MSGARPGGHGAGQAARPVQGLRWRLRAAWAARVAGWIAAATATLIAALIALPPSPGLAQTAPVRRPGSAYMSPTLQALQQDDTRHPGMLWVREGEALWTRPAANGRRCADCHGAQGERHEHGGQAAADAARRHPAFDAALGRPVSLPGRIDQCRTRHLGLPGEGPDGAEVLALSAWLAHLARGQAMRPDPDPRLTPWVERGEQLWRQRLGQLNLACAQCHDQRAGERLGGAPIPEGHATGYPSYRLEWQGLGSLQRRLRGCLVGVRAEPFAADSPDWAALELYLARRAAGMPMEGVALRP